MKICTFEGCTNKHFAKGLCVKHYDNDYYHKHKLRDKSKFKEYQRKFNKSEAGKLMFRRRDLKKYGLTIELYNKMVLDQNGKCKT